MKTTATVFFLLVLTYQAASADPLELSSKEWMSFDPVQRAAFVTGFMNGVEEIFSLHGWQIRSRPDVNISPVIITELLYRRLVQQPELRGGPVRESLWKVIDENLIVTDRTGASLPQWQSLMTASDCAQLILQMDKGKQF